MPIQHHTPSAIGESLPVTVRDQTVWRDPATFPLSSLVILDYDLTCFNTFDAPKGGYEVHEAYEEAVTRVLGKDAHQDFSLQGGLSNRAPLDVIEGLIKEEPRFVIAALDHATEYFTQPEDITDIGLGLIARFARRGRLELDELALRAITEMLVIRKKELLIPQISKDWPRPMPGFVETWGKLNEGMVNGDWPHLETAFASSGHTDFIAKSMEVNDLEHPGIYVTDDEIRRQVLPKTKPDPQILQLIRNAWLNAYLVPIEQRGDWPFQAGIRVRETYVGDDALKDGEMARRDGIGFLHFNRDAPNWDQIGKKLFSLARSAEKAFVE